ncbi:MAG TPA: ATP-binding cassette domain-containing protein [Chloroflexi bacterium]|nr:ATP-binding cassette domain-containing protein [Chloroflexota bacterium]
MTDRELFLQVENLKKYYKTSSGILGRKDNVVKAVDGISFKILKGETLGLVGESGCGKSTTGRTILHLQRPTDGKILFDGADITKLSSKALRSLRPQMQMIFQDPFATLNPRHSVGKIIAEPLVINGIYKRGSQILGDRVRTLMEMVGLNPSCANRFPHEFSGGQRQRIGIARALSLNPSFIVCDEPISSLDVSIQAQIVNLLFDLQEKMDLTYLFIAHDLSMVKHISHRIAVMYLGKLMEVTDKNSLFDDPIHPYTQSLCSAVPIPNPKLELARTQIILEGDPPNPSNPPKGCVFHTRCPLVKNICKEDEPALKELSEDHFVACHLAGEAGGSYIF